jgi:hypothetical protein
MILHNMQTLEEFVFNSALMLLAILCGSQHDLADGLTRTFAPFETAARKSHACPCCYRDFTPEEEDAFVQQVSNFLDI